MATCDDRLSCELIDGYYLCRNPACKNEPGCICNPQASPTPTEVLWNCDIGCNHDSACGSGLECDVNGSGHCRNPACKNETDCVCNPAISCEETVNSGGDGVTIEDVEMGTSEGVFVFEYNTFLIPDKIELFYENQVIFDTDFVGTDGLVTTQIPFGPGSSTKIRVRVTGGYYTAWLYTVHCPNQAQSAIRVSSGSSLESCSLCDVNGDRKIDQNDWMIMEKCVGNLSFSECKNLKIGTKEEMLGRLLACLKNCRDYVPAIKTEDCPIFFNKNEDCPCVFSFQCQNEMKCTGSLLKGDRRCQN